MSGGGTGGHIRPLLSLAHELKKQSNCQLVYVGHRGEKFSNSLPKDIFDQSYNISAGKLRRYPLTPATLLLNVRDAFRVVAGLIQSLRIINRVKPDVVFSKGGFVAVPVVLAARIRRISVVTHDSDSVPGLANRIAGRDAKVHATGMPVEFYKYKSGKMEYTGVPIDDSYYRPVNKSEIRKHLKARNLPDRGFILLVLGGSLGAVSINKNLPAIAPGLLASYPDLQIVHIAGRSYAAETEASYKVSLSQAALKRVKVLSFSEELYYLMAAAGLVVTRAGASTMAELAALQKPCVIVPSPYLAAGHQLKNADWFMENEAAVVIDNDAEAGQWLSTIHDLISDKLKLQELSENIGKLAKPDAAANLARIIILTARSGES